MGDHIICHPNWCCLDRVRDVLIVFVGQEVNKGFCMSTGGIVFVTWKWTTSSVSTLSSQSPCFYLLPSQPWQVFFLSYGPSWQLLAVPMEPIEPIVPIELLPSHHVWCEPLHSPRLELLVSISSFAHSSAWSTLLLSLPYSLSAFKTPLSTLPLESLLSIFISHSPIS